MKVSLDDFLQLFSEELSLSPKSISPKSRFRDLPSWGSLNALLLISRINEEYDVFFTSSDLAACQTIQDIFSNVIQQKK